MKQVYLDYAAITPVSKEVETLMRNVQREAFGNPSSLHAKGLAAKKILDESRQIVAEILQCRAQEIIFTAGGSESTNIAILGVARAALQLHRKAHVITTNIEHHAVLNPCKALQEEGVDVSYVAVDENGLVSVEEIIAAIRPETILVSVIYANNEIGTIQPIAAIGKELKKINKQRALTDLPAIVFHSDACQAAGFLDLDVNHLAVDLLTLNGSKMYGPRRTGILFVRKGIVLNPILYGGGQEHGLRSGTEDVAAAAGFALAFQIAEKIKDKESARQKKLRDYFFEEIQKKISEVIINGAVGDDRLPNNVNVSIANTEGESMVIYLSAKGIYCSTGSACSTALSETSHVILAISNNSLRRATTSLRFSLGRDTSKGDIHFVITQLAKVCVQVRYTMSV